MDYPAEALQGHVVPIFAAHRFNMSVLINIPIPSAERVREFVQKFERHSAYSLADKSLNYLLQNLRQNVVPEHVLLKVVVINQFYSTHVLDPFSVAARIVALRIDSRLAAADKTLIADLTPMEVGDRIHKTRHFYSFATKYCHWHVPDRFPIYDSYVEKMLLHFRGVNGFDNFRSEELKDYPTFVELLSNFQTCFSLKEFTPKELDIYLWMGGKEYFLSESKAAKQD